MPEATMSQTAMITGANIGIGREICRQLALDKSFTTIYLACRNRERADAAAAALRTSTKRNIFEVVIMDVSDVASVKAAIGTIKQPIDWLFMNAGGLMAEPVKLTSAGVTMTLATNLLGHAVLLESLIQANLLKRGAILAGSEASRGVPSMGIKHPEWQSQSVSEFVSVCDGTIVGNKKADQMAVYAQVKHIGALYISAMARKHPQLQLLTISPGNTTGTQAAEALPGAMRCFVKYIANPIIFPLFGMGHSLEVGSRRFTSAIGNRAYTSGGYYASKKGLTGALVDQSIEFPDYRNQAYQEHAYEAVHKFM